MPKAIFNGIDLYYEIPGKGTPLMLIAGLASDSQSWQAVIKDLSRYYLVIIPDNRGVGRTMPQNIEISIRQIVDDSVALIKHLGLSYVNPSTLTKKNPPALKKSYPPNAQAFVWRSRQMKQINPPYGPLKGNAVELRSGVS
jgi:hypothetical protein